MKEPLKCRPTGPTYFECKDIKFLFFLFITWLVILVEYELHISFLRFVPFPRFSEWKKYELITTALYFLHGSEASDLKEKKHSSPYKETIIVRPSAHLPSNSNWIFSGKFRIVVLYRKLYTAQEFLKNRRSGRQTWRQRVNETVPAVSKFVDRFALNSG